MGQDAPTHPRAQIPSQAHTRTRARVHTRACVRAHLLGSTPDGSDLWGGESRSWLSSQRDPQGPRGCPAEEVGTVEMAALLLS